MAGLVAAYELGKLGYQVELYEAGSRIGGRVHTHRFDADPTGSFAELGAMRLPAHHVRTLSYIDELGLSDRLRPFRSWLSDGRAFLAMEPGPVQVSEAAPALVGELRARLGEPGYREESLLFAAWLIAAVRALSPQRLRDQLDNKIVLGRLLGQLDGMNLGPYVRGADRPADLEAFFTDHPRCRKVLPLELDGFLDDVLTEISPALLRLEHGISALPERLALALGSAVHLGHTLTGLRVRERDVILELSCAGRTIVRRVDYAVCAIPFSALRHVRMDGLSQDKAEAIRTTVYCSATKVAFHCRERFWEREGITGGASFTGGDIRQTYYPDHGSVLLASYTIGEEADRLGRMTAERRHEHVRRQLAAIHPALDEPGMVRAAASMAWGQDGLTHGGCTVRWGKTASAAEAERELAARPDKHLFFAGEHCATTPAWIESAVESALEAVQGISLHRYDRRPVSRSA
ncbi:amine oxidase [Spongiactinospora rosea]|uniref:Amine oxidase n=2 Tax=Spongiactinospora rosea TaxID=2248750 RepID=A0A366LMY3_9ACTN|nr:amine oxidase [Spongiactinospora rosea]